MAKTKEKTPAVMGRPTVYSDKIANKICERLADGESLRKICESEEMPGKSTVMRWLLDDNHTDFWERYEKAWKSRAEGYLEEIVEISEEEPVATYTTKDGTVSETIDSAGVNRNRLRVDTRKWVMARMNSKRFGDKQEIEAGPGLAQILASLAPPIE